jgi:hypothetical protein
MNTSFKYYYEAKIQQHGHTTMDIVKVWCKTTELSIDSSEFQPLIRQKKPLIFTVNYCINYWPTYAIQIYYIRDIFLKKKKFYDGTKETDIIDTSVNTVNLLLSLKKSCQRWAPPPPPPPPAAAPPWNSA